MDYYLFPNFLSDPAEYARAESAWRENWKELLAHAQIPTNWVTPWLANQFADGTPCRDGNPIFSAVSRTDRRGIRVIQVPPSSNPRELEIWTDTYDDGGPDPIDELVVSCALTRGTLIDAVSIMGQWLDDGRVELATNVEDSQGRE